MTRDKRDKEEVEEPRKEKVLHARIPAALDEGLRRFARSMRVPVSNVVRILLEDAVAVAQRATDKVAEAAGRASEAALGIGRTEASGLEAVFGYQPLTMAVKSECARCTAPLAAGDEAFLGLKDGAGPRIFVCQSCLPKSRRSKKRSSA